MFQKLITENIETLEEVLEVQPSETSNIYSRPKKRKIENPERPVVSSINCDNNTTSKYFDFYLQPIVRNTPSYVRYFLKKLDKVKNIPNDSLLVTLDVKSLCTNIPDNEGKFIR